LEISVIGDPAMGSVDRPIPSINHVTDRPIAQTHRALNCHPIPNVTR
jgi:hypothetical protein